MATQSDVSTRVASLLGTDANLSTAEILSLCQTRYETLCDLFVWSRRLREFTITTVAQTASSTSDTVTVTNGSSTITSAGTPFTAGMAGRQIAIGTSVVQYFYVSSFTDSANLVLGDGEGNAVTWPGSTSAGNSWRIFQTIYTLPTDAEDIWSLAGDGEIDEYDGGRAALDIDDPYRLTTNTYPTRYCWAGEATTGGLREIELWPVPSSAVLLRGQYMKAAATLAASTALDVPVPLLVYGTAADACGLLQAKEQSPQWAVLQGFYEGKFSSALEDYRRKDQGRLSLPRTIGRSPGGRHGQEWFVTHHGEEP